MQTPRFPLRLPHAPPRHNRNRRRAIVRPTVCVVALCDRNMYKAARNLLLERPANLKQLLEFAAIPFVRTVFVADEIL